MSQTHELKTAPEYFARVWSGDKPFEVRYDDRGYQTGDRLVLREWDRGLCIAARPGTPCLPDRPHVEGCPGYTGRAVLARIGFTLSYMPGRAGGFNGNGWVVLGLCDMSQRERLGVGGDDGRRPAAPPSTAPLSDPVAHPGVPVVVPQGAGATPATSAPSPADVARVHLSGGPVPPLPVFRPHLDQREQHTEGEPR